MRKLLMLTMAVVAVMAATASTASAFVVHDFDTGDPCDASLVVSGSTVSGGCLLEDFAGGFTMYAGQSIIQTFGSSFDLRVDSAGELYAVDQAITSSGWGRQPCRAYPSGETTPWAGQLTRVGEDEHGQGIYEADLDICLTLIGGYSGQTETITVDVGADYNSETGTSLLQDGASQSISDGFWDSNDTLMVVED